MNEDNNEMFRRRAIDNIFNELLGRSIVTEDKDKEERKASENYKTLQTLGFVKGVYRACYDNLCMVEKVRIPFSGYMKAEDIEKYNVMLEEVLYKLEGLSDLLEMFDDRIGEVLDVWKEEERE